MQAHTLRTIGRRLTSFGHFRHSITAVVLDGRHPAYSAAAALADLAHPEYGGLHDEDAAEVSDALVTIRNRVQIPGQLGELFAIAAEIAYRAYDDEDIGAALREVAADYPVRTPVTVPGYAR